jgi:hypothetical protein
MALAHEWMQRCHRARGSNESQELQAGICEDGNGPTVRTAAEIGKSSAQGSVFPGDGTSSVSAPYRYARFSFLF